VDQSSRTDKRSVAATILKRIEREIELGEFRKSKPTTQTFLSAAITYMEAGRRKRYVAKLIKHFGETPLDQIDQAAIDAAAIALHPNAGNATRNAAVYTPISAILHHVGVDIKLKRPKGAKGRVVTTWLRPEDADAIITAADQIDQEFGTLLRALLYTGLRIGEVLDRWRWEEPQSRRRRGMDSARERGHRIGRQALDRSSRGVACSAAYGRPRARIPFPAGRTPQAHAAARQARSTWPSLPCPPTCRLEPSR
jgi:integrase